MFTPKFAEQIDKLEEFVTDFPYAELRQEKYAMPNGEDYFGATPTSIRKLLNFFSTHLLHAKQDLLAKEFSTLEKQVRLAELAGSRESNIELIHRLAKAMLHFQSNVRDTENNYWQDKPLGDFKKQLRNDSTWVKHFHYIMEQYLDQYPDISKIHYNYAIKSIQKLGASAYSCLQKNDPLNARPYQNLSAPNQNFLRKRNRDEFNDEFNSETMDSQATKQLRL